MTTRTREHKFTWLSLAMQSRVRDWVRIEISSPVLWAPVFIGLGITFYFGLKSEPSFWTGFSATAIATLLFLGFRKRSDLRFLSLAVLCTAIGYTAGILRTHAVSAPILENETRAILVEGSLIEIENRQDTVRYLIAVSYLEKHQVAETPVRVRVVWRGHRPTLAPGDKVRMRSILSPPPEPVMPGGYDFARQLYFERIGGVGYAVSAPVKIHNDETGMRLSESIETFRVRLADRISEKLEGMDPGIVAVCIALVTGKRDGITEETEQVLRDAGLAHLLAISGLHMGLVAGLLFLSIRFILACSTRLALHYPIKKWAAIAALAGAFFYLLLSGAGWSTRRAFIMAAVVFVAVILDRRGISLRNVAVAAVIILLTTPEALFQAGFQMSFAAVTVLIAAYEWYQKRQVAQSANDIASKIKAGRTGLIARYFAGLSVTSILAGFATAPFGLFHFNRYAAYGLAGNLLAMPVMAFVTMPAAVLAFALMPLDLDGVAWWLMGKSVELILATASYVSAWPGAVANVPTISTFSFAFFLMGGLILCLLKTPLRVAGAVLLVLAVVLMPLRQVEQVVIGRDGRNMAFLIEHAGKQKLVPWKNTTERFAVGNWLRSAGQGEELNGVSDIRELAAATHPAVECNSDGCRIELASGHEIQILENASASEALCTIRDVILLPGSAALQTTDDCNAVILDKTEIARSGAISILISGDRIRVRTNATVRGNRPWSVPPNTNTVLEGQ